MRKRKFRPGQALSAEQAIAHLIAHRWIYWNHKPQHPGWMRSMQLNSVIGAANSGLLREALPADLPSSIQDPST